ncbi:MAG TPA: protein kinase [Thermoanaerobaculia bacterium]|nr:protein kinase [Thermoanaerobaculia bacterium]
MTQSPSGSTSSRRFRWARLGDYDVIEPLGEGGMGFVLRALDTRLGRQVALKLLPERVTGDADWLARFEREARVLASLNHPNVATLYGFEEATGVPAPPAGDAAPTRQRFLVMEVVEGETLAERLKRGPLALAECLEVFIQIAHGLDAAHEKGIVHRDLKPANVKVGAGDRVKILDFGLAKAVLGTPSGPAPGAISGSSIDATESPTLVALAATQRGEILGTAAYMSPEQARGTAVDKRTDVWAFGCCLYESLTGRAAFGGDSVADILAAVLREEPDWSALAGRVPVRLERLVRRCLEKKAARRLRDIGDAALELEDLLRNPDQPLPAAAAPTGPTRRRALLLGAIAAAIALLAGLGAGLALRRAPVRTTVAGSVRRFSETLPAARGSSIHSLALSDDGRFLAIASADPGRPLWFRRLDQTTVETLPGTEQGEFPFFSPDGEWLAFFTGFENALKKMPTSGGGQVVTLADGLKRNWGGSWGPDGKIVFHSQSGGEGLSRVSALGGPTEVLTKPDAAADENSHRWPQVLPGGAGVLFTVWKGSADASSIAYLSLATGEKRDLLPGTFARYLPTGHLVYFVDSRMMAAPFDAARGEVTGPPVPVQSVESAGPWGYRTVASTPDGLQVQAQRPASRLLWIDQDGQESEISLPRGSYRSPSVSPDGTRIALALAEGGRNADIWTFDLDGGSPTRVTTRGENMSPVWTPDGEWLLFWSERDGIRTVYRKRSDGTGEEEKLVDGEQGRPVAVSPDGDWLTTNHRDDIWLVPVHGGEPKPFVQTPFVEGGANFSPDGQWVVYQGFETGNSTHYLRRADGSGTRVSVAGDAANAHWARNGRELLYVEQHGTAMMAREFRADGSVGPARKLFDFPYHFEWDIAPDGRFLVVSEREAPRLVFVENWFQELREMFPMQ